MSRFLELMLGLAAFAACLGIAVAGTGCGGESAGERTGLRFEGTEPGDCIDDADNDADGLFDCNDPGCAGAAICSGGGTGGTDGIGGSGGIGGAGGMSGSGGIAGSGGIGGAGGIGGGCEENSCSNFAGGAECGVIPTRCGGEEQAIFCGTCLGSQVCVENRCVCPAGADCGEGCGDRCGPDEVCVEGECCEPTYPCAENECSPPGGFPDGCGGITQCPECRDGEDCVLSNELVFECLVDDIIELVGSACDTFKSGDVTFSAEFPCGAIIVE